MKLRIGPRMIAGFLIMSGLLLLAGFFTIRYMNYLQENTSKILAENVSSLKAAEELEIALLDMKGLTSYYLLDGDEHWLEEFEEKRASYIGWYKKAQADALTPEEKEIIREIETLYNTYINYQGQVVKLYREGLRQQAYQILVGEMRSTFLLIYNKCEEFLSVNEDLINYAGHQIEAENQTARKIVYGIAAIGLFMGLLLGVVLSRSITHPLYELVLKVKGATENELVEKVDIENETELDHLDRHVRLLIDKVYETNKEVEQSRRMLMQSEKLAAIGQIAAGVAHEIYNPLAAIKMLLFSLQKELSLDSRESEDFEVITKEVARMERFIQNFLEFARPQVPEKSLIDLNDTVEKTLSLLSPQLADSAVRVEKNLLVSPPPVYADNEQVQQVLVNVILNAIQAMPGGGAVKIESKTRKYPAQSGGSFSISISDTGAGIPPQVLKTLFDPFVTTKSSGTGLGLSIAYQIMKNHDGWIEAANNPDKGAAFTIVFPLKGDIKDA